MKRQNKNIIYDENGRYSTILWDTGENELGCKIVMNVRDGKFSIVKQNWGTVICKASSVDEVVEKEILLDETNTKKLMENLDAADERELLLALRLCLQSHVLVADSDLIYLCEHFGAEYEIQNHC